MDLTDEHVELIRDYVGSTPETSALYAMSETVTYWQEIAIRILRRRLADAAGGQNSPSFTLSGVLTVGATTTDLSTMKAQIADLESQIAALTGSTPTDGGFVSRIRRADRIR